MYQNMSSHIHLVPEILFLLGKPQLYPFYETTVTLNYSNYGGIS